jgi:hypothetical protein
VTHAEVHDRLGDYLEGGLALAQRALLDAHIDNCPDCALQLESLRNTIRLLRNLSEVDVPVAVADAVMQRLEAGEGQPTWWIRLRDAVEAHSRPRHLATIAMAAVAVTIVAISRPGLLPLGFPARGGPQVQTATGTLVSSSRVSPDGFVRRLFPDRPDPILIGTSRAESPELEPLPIPPFQSHSLVAGITDPNALIAAIAALPPAERSRWIELHAGMAARLGLARRLADRLRTVHDPQAEEIANRLIERADFTDRQTR